jgi:hypothetical protein
MQPGMLDHCQCPAFNNRHGHSVGLPLLPKTSGTWKNISEWCGVNFALTSEVAAASAISGTMALPPIRPRTFWRQALAVQLANKGGPHMLIMEGPHRDNISARTP